MPRTQFSKFVHSLRATVGTAPVGCFAGQPGPGAADIVVIVPHALLTPAPAMREQVDRSGRFLIFT
jgi:hypothetical protein